MRERLINGVSLYIRHAVANFEFVSDSYHLEYVGHGNRSNTDSDSHFDLLFGNLSNKDLAQV